MDRSTSDGRLRRLRRLAAIAAASAAVVCVPGVAASQPVSLTAMDYVEIRQLAARYAHALDSAARDGHALADLFTADGELVRPDARGRDEIAAVARADGARGPAHVAQFATNHVIVPAPEGARGWQYLVELRFDAGPQGRGNQGPNGQPPTQRELVGRIGGAVSQVGGRYEDVYTRTADGWRFKRREFIPSAAGGGSAQRSAAPIPSGAPFQAPPPPPSPAGGQASASPSTLTAMDYLEIERLVVSYGHALDSGFNSDDNGAAYASLFTPDGIFYSRGRPVQGHDALAALARAQPHGPDYVRHYLTNHVIEPSPEGAVGRQYLVVLDIGENGAPGTVFLGGYYEDVYVRTAEGWRFSTRRSFGARSGP